MGRGSCNCGRCDCESGFEGQFCQRSVYQSTCEKLEPCIKYEMFTPEGDNARERELTKGIGFTFRR